MGIYTNAELEQLRSQLNQAIQSQNDLNQAMVSNFSFSDVFGSTDIPNVGDYTSGFSNAIDTSGLGDGVSNIAGDTSAIKDSMEVSSDELKYLRDIAEQEAVNRFTTAEIKIEQTNNNNISSDMDLDGVVSGLTDAVNEAVDIMTEGVHD